jgi:hypothetical protein
MKWLNPDRDAARDAFARLLDSRERCDTAGTIRAQRELRKLGWRVDLLRPTPAWGYGR